MIFKDHFSTRSEAYAQYRPIYPDALFSWLAAHAPSTTRCWDCATGSGQAALGLSRHFDKVIATDASAEQISNTISSETIDYRVALAEDSSLEPTSIDLITVAQALHWFDIPAFFNEANRVLKPQGLLAILSYKLFNVDADIDAAVFELYDGILDDYWPTERRIIEQDYAEIELPYPLMETPGFTMQVNWDLKQLTGYLNTWSAVKRYIAANSESPLRQVENILQSAWGDPLRKKNIRWPLTIRVAVKPEAS